MLGLFLQPDAITRIAGMDIAPLVKGHALEVVAKGYTVVRGAVPPEVCRDTIAAFRRFERANEAIFGANRNEHGHYPRLINLHTAMPGLLRLFTQNKIWLAVQDVLFGAPTALYTSLFYEVGSQQPLHRDTPVFATRPEYLYFGSSVYLEASDDGNGCLEVMPGGHLIPELDREALALRRYGALDKIPDMDGEGWEEYQNTVVAAGRQRRLATRTLHAQPGDSVIWHPQLPHGGTAIRDVKRTRFSLVMHTTPVGVPVYHMDAFLAPGRPFPQHAPWGYREVDGRQIADLAHGVGFGHDRGYDLSQFNQPELTA
jgi:phytanoyl-CoA hydroxylase